MKNYERKNSGSNGLKNQGSLMQTCRNINVHVVNTDVLLRST